MAATGVQKGKHKRKVENCAIRVQKVDNHIHVYLNRNLEHLCCTARLPCNDWRIGYFI